MTAINTAPRPLRPGRGVEAEQPSQNAAAFAWTQAAVLALLALNATAIKSGSASR